MGASLGAIVLAAGRSKRFRSAVPKVLHRAAGRPLAVWVLEALRVLHRSQKLQRVVLVVPPGGAVEESLSGLRYPFDLRFAVQKQPLGTGDAARRGLGELGEVSEVLVCAGDGPLLSPRSLRSLVRSRRSSKGAVALLTAELDDPGSYGRVIRHPDGSVAAIVEAADAKGGVREVREVNASTYAFERSALERVLPRLRRTNAQSELLLTDAIAALVTDGVEAVTGDPTEILGANTRRQFEELSAILRGRVLDSLMDGGVAVVDPRTTYVDAGVKVGADTVLLPNTFLEGATSIAKGCEIGPNVRLVDTRVGEGSRMSFAVARGSRIGPRCEVGPFASLRAGTVLKAGAKVGTFVETKEAVIGEGTKVPHLSYMGDVTIGTGTNVGAGTITCNYDPFKPGPDGETKHHTRIGDDVFIGSDTMLVAPVRLGDRTRTGAGSVVNRDVSDDTLVVGAPARPAATTSKVSRKAAKRSVSKRKGRG